MRNFTKKYENQGGLDPRAHCWSRPRVSESTAVLTALELAYWSGVKLHIYHSSFPRIFELVESFRLQGAKVTAETCPHYLVFSEDDMLTMKAKSKINPPLRSREEADELWNNIQQGKVHMITSDHAPWLIGSKQKSDIFANASGAPGVETLLPVIFSEGVSSGKITILDMVKCLCEHPAQLFGLGHRKGKLEVGMDGDVVIINPQDSYLLDEAVLHSSAQWSPYHGRKIQGRITHTFLRGRMIYDGIVTAEQGSGKFVHPMF